MASCPICLKSFKNAHSLAQHKWWFQGSCLPEMTEDEFLLLAPVEDDYSKVLCNACGQAIGKRTVLNHIKVHHPEVLEDSKEWIVKKDLNMLKNQKKRLDENSPFTKAWGRKLRANLQVADLESLDGAEDESPFDGEASLGDAEDEVPPTPNEAAPPTPEEAPPAPGPPAEQLALQWEAPQAPQPAPPNPAVPQPAAAPAHDVLAVQLQSLENRILNRMDEIVGGFNQVLQVGLGEVQAKYMVALPDWLVDWDPSVQGKNFPPRLLAVNFNIEDFKLVMFEFRGLDSRTATNILRDVRRFLGCFIFPDEAGMDLGHLMVSIFRHGLLRPLLTNKLWNCKQNYLKSLKSSLKHFVEYLENESRMVRAFGGLTTALGSLARALDYEMSGQNKQKEAQRKTARAVKDAKLIENWVGAAAYTVLVLKAYQGLRYIGEHAADEGFWDKWVHALANQFIVLIIYLNMYPGRCGGWEQITKEEMEEQLRGELVANKAILVFAKHKTVKTYGPLKKWVPRQVLEALVLYAG